MNQILIHLLASPFIAALAVLLLAGESPAPNTAIAGVAVIIGVGGLLSAAGCGDDKEAT